MENCIFCKLAAHEIPANVVFEDDEVFAFHDLSPQAPVHALVIPKAHVANLAATSGGHAQLLGKLTRAAAQIAEALGIAASGYRVVINSGADGGQTVGHLHLHVLGGRPMAWPPG